jgi:hypothetical protein
VATAHEREGYTVRLKEKIAFALVLCICGSCCMYADEGICKDMLEHKQECLKKIIADPARGGNRSYPLSRVIETISADDVDGIPKQPGAGEVFEKDGEQYQLMHNGVKVILHGYCGAWMTDVIHGLRGHHEPQEE